MRTRSVATSWCVTSNRATVPSARRSPGRSLASLQVKNCPAWAMRSAPACTSRPAEPTHAINLIVRASVPPQSLQRAIQSAIDRVNRDQALSDVRTLEQIVNQSMVANRVTSTILAVFASIALLLAAGGIYGVVSYTAAQRTHEMGIRAALGASAGHLRRLIFQGGMQLTVIGLLIGLAGTDVTTRVVSSMLYGVGNDDPLTDRRCGRRALRRSRTGVFLTSLAGHESRSNGSAEVSVGGVGPAATRGQPRDPAYDLRSYFCPVPPLQSPSLPGAPFGSS